MSELSGNQSGDGYGHPENPPLVWHLILWNCLSNRCRGRRRRRRRGRELEEEPKEGAERIHRAWWSRCLSRREFHRFQCRDGGGCAGQKLQICMIMHASGSELVQSVPRRSCSLVDTFRGRCETSGSVGMTGGVAKNPPN